MVSRLKARCPVYLVNVKGEEIQHYTKLHKKIQCIGFGSLKGIKKNSFVIVEDIISISKEQELQLRNAINYTAHHKLSKIFCVTHTIYKTGLYSMLPLFHSIIFTSSASNTPIVRATLGYFKIEKSKVVNWLEQLKQWSKRLKSEKAYFFFDCTSMTFCLSTNTLLPDSIRVLGSLLSDDKDDDNPSLVGASSSKSSSTADSAARRIPSNAESLADKMTRRFSGFFANHAFQSQALAIFSILLENFGPKKINPVDLTISFQSKQTGGGAKKISTVDYVAALLTPHGHAEEEYYVLHNYVSRACVIPTSCIRNEAFSKRHPT